MHIEFDPEARKPLHNHPAMIEIEAISKLQHKNIVGYKGCWVEAEEPDSQRVQKIIEKLSKGRGWLASIGDSIEESDEDDPQLALSNDLNKELEIGFKERA